MVHFLLIGYNLTFMNAKLVTEGISGDCGPRSRVSYTYLMAVLKRYSLFKALQVFIVLLILETGILLSDVLEDPQTTVLNVAWSWTEGDLDLRLIVQIERCNQAARWLQTILEAVLLSKETVDGAGRLGHQGLLFAGELLIAVLQLHHQG